VRKNELGERRQKSNQLEKYKDGLDKLNYLLDNNLSAIPMHNGRLRPLTLITAIVLDSRFSFGSLVRLKDYFASNYLRFLSLEEKLH
jgi:hypothetical protein